MQSVQEMLAVFTFILASFESLSGILPTGQSCVVPSDGRQTSCSTHPHSLCSTHTTFPPVHFHPVRRLAETAGRTDTRLELSGDIFPRGALGSSTFLEGSHPGPTSAPAGLPWTLVNTRSHIWEQCPFQPLLEAHSAQQSLRIFCNKSLGESDAGGGPWGPFCTLCMRHSLPPGTCRETGALTGSHGLSVNFKKLWFLTLKRFLFCFVFVKSLDI